MQKKKTKVKKVRSRIVGVFARRVKACRKRKDWSQLEFAIKAETHLSFVGRAERGESNVTIQTVEKFAAVLGVPPHELLMPDVTVGVSLEPIRKQLCDSIDTTLKTCDRASLEALALVAAAVGKLQSG